MNETIYLNEVLQIMRTPSSEGRAVKFDISYRTFNKNSKTGGKLKYHVDAKLVMKEKPSEKAAFYALLKKPSRKKEVFRKNPNHFSNKTRNIRLENGDITKIHIKYIITFNGKKVIY